MNLGPKKKRKNKQTTGALVKLYFSCYPSVFEVSRGSHPTPWVFSKRSRVGKIIL
jgi:hypothetical protein